MTDKTNLKKCNSKYWAWGSLWKGLMQRKVKNHKRSNYDYWTLDLYGPPAKKYSIKN